MSLLWQLRRYIDSIQHRKEDSEQQRKRDVLPPDVEPDQIDFAGAGTPVPVRYACRLCDYQCEDSDGYCLRCLAPTMKRAAPNR